MIRKIALLIMAVPLLLIARAQETWPKKIEVQNGGTITLYQPQLESIDGNKISGRSAFSVKQTSSAEPVFGTFWFVAIVETNLDNRMAILKSISVKDIRLAGVDDAEKINKLKSILESEIPKIKLDVTIDEILANIEEEQRIKDENFKNDPPEIIYTTKTSTLVLIDGEPKLEKDDKLNMKRVINTAFLIIQYPEDNKYYLYGGSRWYVSGTILSGWQPISKLPGNLQELDKQIKEQEKKQNQSSNVPTTGTPGEIIISTKPAELIQSEGEANFANISGTNLLYVTNSQDHIFMDGSSNKYYVLLSGRWYSASSLKGKWAYIASDQLPADFAKIPKGTDKDVVLASVAGTEEAADAVKDAQIPQTAKVDRKQATCTVTYNGDPEFEKIEGTGLYLAKNTNSTVIRSGNDYYCVENGVWFKSAKATGPWAVSDERPKDVENIPASSEAYNTKYVYIYDTTPEYVYVGYTPGYMGCYIYGPTVVYGTGFYYNPWYGPYYYPRPVTYGFSMHYNPWMGWSMGFHYSYGFFHFSFYTGGYHGYWGPPVYRPPYYNHYHGGMYGGRGPVYINGDVNINVDRSRNLYNKQNGVSTADVKRNPSNNASAKNKMNNKANQQPANMKKNNVVSDRQGNVYQQDKKGNWQQRDGNTWKPAPSTSTNDLNKQMQNRQKSTNMNKSYNQATRPVTSGAPARRPAARPAGRPR